MSRSEDRFGPLPFFAAVCLIGAVSVVANAQVPDSLTACRALEDDAARLACYDEAMSRDKSSPEVAASAATDTTATTVTTAATTAAVPATVPLDDEVGRESLNRGDEPAIVGRLVECRGDYRSKYHFYFDNGQVWKQTNNARIRWNDCNFDVNIEKDAFGYKMNRVGDKKTVRISRVR